MHVLSNIPVSDRDQLTEQPFTFVVEGETFTIKPLSLRTYLEVERRIHHSLFDMIHLQDSARQEALHQFFTNVTVPTESQPDRNVQADSILLIMIDCLDPEPVWRIAHRLFRHNRKRWFAPSKWVWNRRNWFEKNLSLNQLIALVSYLVRYCTEKKTELLSLCLKGIGSATNENKTTSPSSDSESPLDFLSPGGLNYGTSEQLAS